MILKRLRTATFLNKITRRTDIQSDVALKPFRALSRCKKSLPRITSGGRLLF
jgi:hypothetical protein